jgi:hypothetical protein
LEPKVLYLSAIGALMYIAKHQAWYYIYGKLTS